MFEQIPSQWIVIGSTVMAVVMGTLVMTVRAKSAKKPASAKKIILPPLFMSTGAFMFVFEYFRVPPLQILESIGVGLLFSTVLIWTSRFEVKNGDIYLDKVTDFTEVKYHKKSRPYEEKVGFCVDFFSIVFSSFLY